MSHDSRNTNKINEKTKLSKAQRRSKLTIKTGESMALRIRLKSPEEMSL